MEVIDVDERESEIALAPLDLIVQVSRGQAVASGHDVLRLHYARPVILAVEETAISLLGAWWRALERNVSALGADHYFFPLDLTAGEQDANRFTDCALRALTSVNNGSVQHMHALLKSRNDSCRITSIFSVIAFAEVSAEAK